MRKAFRCSQCNYISDRGLGILFRLIAGRVCSPHYMSPEVIANRTYGKPCDVWAAGVMLHLLLSGRLPFMGSGKRLQDVMSRGRISVSRTRKEHRSTYMGNELISCVSIFLSGTPEHDCSIRRSRMGRHFYHRKGPGYENAVAQSEEPPHRRRNP